MEALREQIEANWVPRHHPPAPNNNNNHNHLHSTPIALTAGTHQRRAWSVAEVAKLLGRHKATVYRLIYAGYLRTVEGTGEALISESELNRFLTSSNASRRRRKV
jgi:excisionase family DNA binding protein